jgi:hypothetical protein
MEINTILTRCSSPKEKCPLCWECKRNAPVQNEDETAEDFSITETRMSGWKCDGYISVRQPEKGLFDE